MSSQEQGNSARETPQGPSLGTTTSAADQAGTPRQAGDARQYVPRPAPGYDDMTAPAAGAAGMAMGLTLAAAVLLTVSGIWNFLEGLAGVIKGQFFVITNGGNYIYSFSTTGWGWTHLFLGVVVAAVGVSLFWDQWWARAAAVVIAALSAVGNFLFIPYTPVWSIVVIALDVFVIWALLTPRRSYA